MKKLFLILLISPVFGFGQGEQRYADGTATDQDGNTFEWINYGTQDWAIENAEVVTYRDGTPIPQVTDATEWTTTYTNAWCYIDNDSSKGKLYKWKAVAGIHDAASFTDISKRKEFAPNGWRVPNFNDWETLKNYLIANGYNYDGTTTGNKIAKAMASTTGWVSSSSVGNDQSLNNKSGFNAIPVGTRHNTRVDGGGLTSFNHKGTDVVFWSLSTQGESGPAKRRTLHYRNSDLRYGSDAWDYGFSVRFVRDASTASTNKYSNAITIYPNPTTSIVTLQGDKRYDIEVYTLQGKKVMALTGNTIDMSHLSSATYIVKALDKVENEEVSYKVVKN